MNSTAKKAASSSLEEVDDTVSRLAAHKGVEAVMILSTNGEIIQSTFLNEKEQAKLILQVKKCSDALLPGEDLSFIRIRSLKHEVLIAPTHEYCLVVLHNPLISNVDKAI
jgi:dynein light chain roadblock-type